MSLSQKKAKLELYVGGLPRQCYGMTVQAGTQGLQLTVSVDPTEGYMAEGEVVEADLGYQEGTHLVFTGVVTTDDATLNPWWQEVRCGGNLKKINDRINVEDPTASGTPTTGTLPVLVDTGP
jgi:hypothetical protein